MSIPNVMYFSTGYVYGKYWGGGEGAYTAKPLMGNTKESIIEQANKGLDGSLDSGMGYESLIGAILIIKEEKQVSIDGEIYTHTETTVECVGNLSDEQTEFLYNIVDNE